MNIFKKPWFAISIVIILLLAITLFYAPTQTFDGTDSKDYTDTAKFFAGEYSAKQRASHAILYGLSHSPFVKITQSFTPLKISSILFLFLIILSIYYLSNQNKKTLLLILTTPIIWYMAPWISPMALVAFLFLWAYYFIGRFEKTDKPRYIMFSALLMGLASAFWGAAIFISAIFMLCFLYNKKFIHSWLFFAFLIIGFFPRLIVDQIVFSLPLYSIIKHISSDIAFALYGGIYNQGWAPTNKILVLFFIPFYSWLLFKKQNFLKYKKSIIFLTISVIFVLSNSQIRLVLPFVPIIILLLGNIMNKKQFKIQLIIFIIISLITISPYIAQFKYETNGIEIKSAIDNINNLTFSTTFTEKLIEQDVNQIANEFPDKTFVVGNDKEYYRELAHIYWGENVEEFVSMEDYNLAMNNKSTIISKKISSNSNIQNRREIWIAIGLDKNSNDKTDYNAIEYAISFDEEFELENFKLEKQYNILRVLKKQ